MPGFSYPVAILRGVPVITAPAQIDVGHADQLRAALLQTAALGHATFVVDMSGTSLCDTAGLHVLVRAHHRAVAEGGELRLVIATAAVRRLFTVTGIDRVIPSFASLDEALIPTPAIRILGPGSAGLPWSRPGTAWR